ncbi:MAG: bifunctional homocysteine S-methyltransferase/methylenetetrahydrofolate reductase [Alicyclobacillus macrosporangiidus]|uniref:bifunctional homocysteine S-methyltransferase/methylenetetrahydrofolate reductase n=1 Tax=Alicyclobacillus macrosporangiidus TaxID=392015 RepID=UPI0026EAB7EA|nr:bifunctional homocysteine S-methyltransferase/methylenetetrahydrofolate reductase [Alicyclobacillus macrosporangiidus]MCL6597739.1 bifunctional homocysteine S-methyltransferase/methylenetetrahydrofolate reductase [Alicyclobacillus macrosporangiidus]
MTQAGRSWWERARAGVLVGDGAMATQLHQMGVPIRACCEALCVSRPELVERVHRAYLVAGSDWIQTNTFGGHRAALARYGMEDQVREINRAAVRVARQAVERAAETGADVDTGGGADGIDRAGRTGPAAVLGTIGSALDLVAPGGMEARHRAWLRGLFEEQAEALLAAGVDGLLLETFPALDELLLALDAVRRLTDRPVLAHLSPDAVGVTRDGVPVREAFTALLRAGADGVGLNCRLGPNGVLRTYEGVARQPGVVYSAAPNAGMLHLVDGDIAYTGDPDYFAAVGAQLVHWGVRVVAGCCGTTPAHIRKLKERLQAAGWLGVAAGGRDGFPPEAAGPDGAPEGSKAPDRVQVRARQSGAGAEEEWRGQSPAGAGDAAAAGRGEAEGRGVHAGPGAPAGSLVERANRGRTVVVELDPPRTLDIRRYLEGAIALQRAGADAITLADNSLGQVRVSNMAVASLLKQAGVEPLVHVTCRDRNLIGQQSHLMGLHVLGIHHVLLVTGDPSRFGDLPGATSVYDVSSIELTKMVKRLNQGIAFSGQPMKHPSRFVVGTSFNPHVANFEKAIDRLRRKLDAGADFVMTQPVFDVRMFECIARAAEPFGVPVFAGVMPLTSARNARFLHHEVPGIRIPDEILGRMEAASPEAAAEEGLSIAETLLDEAMRCFNGIYLVTPFLRYDLTVRLVQFVRARADAPLAPRAAEA